MGEDIYAELQAERVVTFKQRRGAETDTSQLVYAFAPVELRT